MSTPTVSYGHFTVERRYPAPPHKVFAAFSQIEKKRRWFAEGPGFALDSYTMDFREGGFEAARFRFVGAGPIDQGTPMGNDTVYLDIVPDRRIVNAYSMTIGNRRISSSLATVEFLPDGEGTRLVTTEQGAYFDGADGPKMRETGWRALLEALAKEVERM